MVTLTAAPGQSPLWILAPGSPGILDASSGQTVHYQPPGSGTITSDTPVTVAAVLNEMTIDVAILVVAGSGRAATGTTGATPVTPTVPSAGDPAGDTPPSAPTPGLYLLAGNDFGPGAADGLGTAARFDSPAGIARDGNGVLYVADQGSNVVRRVTPDGAVTTLAGSPGSRGYADGIGAGARFSALGGIAVDSKGNVYVADNGNAVIRKITPGGVVSTLAGQPGVSGQADGTGSMASFSGAMAGLAVDDAGTLYVSDQKAVRKVNSAGAVTTLAGSGSFGGQDGPAMSASFTGLKGIALDRAGNVYVVDAGFVHGGMMSNVADYSAAVRRISADGVVSTIAGLPASGKLADPNGYVDGPGAQARFSAPAGIAIDRSGNLYVADRGNDVIRRIAPDGTVTTVAGKAGQGGGSDGAAANARFALPEGIASDADGNLYVADTANDTVRKISANGNVSTLAGAAPRSGSADGVRTAVLFDHPSGLALSPAGDLYLADTNNALIRLVGNDSHVITLAGAAGQEGNADGTATAARFRRPMGLAADAQGNLAIADYGNDAVRRLMTGGMVSTLARIGEARSVAYDADGNLFVVSGTDQTIGKLTPQGTVSTFAGNRQSAGSRDGVGTDASFFMPRDLTVDAAGNLYVIDGNGALIRKITPSGAVSTLAGTPFVSESRDGTGSAAHFASANGIAVDADGNVYVGDVASIRRITPKGVVSTIAGAGAPAAANTGRFSHPASLVMKGPKSLAFTAGNGVFLLQLPGPGQ